MASSSSVSFMSSSQPALPVEKKIRVGILGGAGYTGGELLRLLLNHPRVEVAFIQSRSRVGMSVGEVHSDLRGLSGLQFTSEMNQIQDPSLGAIFLALPHGEAKKVLQEFPIANQVCLIDLSQDFRLEKGFVYGLPELNREKIKTSKRIANPGCFATAIQLALLPLAREGLLSKAVVTGITGATGAGQKLSETSHFSFRANNIQAYKTLDHQHIAEVEESLRALQGNSKPRVSFIPWRGDFTRGIFVSAHVEVDRSGLIDLYQSYYESHPFIEVSSTPIDLKSVLNTNRAFIEVNEGKKESVIHVVLDNLLKGASGQAVQNLNLAMGFAETEGLKLKGVAF